MITTSLMTILMAILMGIGFMIGREIYMGTRTAILKMVVGRS